MREPPCGKFFYSWTMLDTVGDMSMFLGLAWHHDFCFGSVGIVMVGHFEPPSWKNRLMTYFDMLMTTGFVVQGPTRILSKRKHTQTYMYIYKYMVAVSLLKHEDNSSQPIQDFSAHCGIKKSTWSGEMPNTPWFPAK